MASRVSPMTFLLLYVKLQLFGSLLSYWAVNSFKIFLFYWVGKKVHLVLGKNKTHYIFTKNFIEHIH